MTSSIEGGQRNAGARASRYTEHLSRLRRFYLPRHPRLQVLQLLGVGVKGFSLALVLGFNVREDNATGGFIKEAGGGGRLGAVGGVPHADKAALTHWAVGEVYTCFGLATCLLAFGFVLIPRSREFFALSHDQVKDWFRHEYPHAFESPTVPESRQTT